MLGVHDLFASTVTPRDITVDQRVVPAVNDVLLFFEVLFPSKLTGYSHF